MTTITALPTAPARTMDAPTFVTTADTFVAALPPMVTQINTVAGEINTNATLAVLSAQEAKISQNAAKASEDNAQLYKTTAQSAAAAAQSAAGLPALKAGRVLRSPDGINVEFGNVDGDVVYANQSRQIPLAKTVLANSINGLLELTTPSNPQPGDWFVVADQGNASKNNIVIKRAGTNLFSDPETFTSSAWGLQNITVTQNTDVAPDGTLTADTITTGSGNVAAVLSQLVSNTIDTHTFSIFIKPKSGVRYVQLLIYATLEYVNFDLQVGAVTQSTAKNATISPVSKDGYYRISMTAHLGINNGVLFLGVINSATSYRAEPYSGGAGSTAAVWGSKLELGDSVTFYDPATPSQNMIPYSAPKITDWWIQTRLIATANSYPAPNGSMTAAVLTEDASVDATHSMYITHAPSIGVPYTFSVDVAPIGRDWVLLDVSYGGVYSAAWFDIKNGVMGVIGAQTAAVSISKNPVNGYYRISIATHPTINNVPGTISIYPCATNGSLLYTGDGRAAIAVANTQLETGLIATPRIATNGAPATRTGNPTKIMGIADDLAIRRNYQNCRMTYQDDLMGWVLR